MKKVQKIPPAFGQACRKPADGFKKNLSFLCVCSVSALCWLCVFTEDTASKDRKYTEHAPVNVQGNLINTSFSPFKTTSSWQN